MTKELLKEVLGMYATPYDITQKDSKLFFSWDNSSGKASSDVNIYQLAHMCKEWAFDNDYSISSYKEKSSQGNMYRVSVNNGNMSTARKTEPEAVFAASEWILKENK